MHAGLPQERRSGGGHSALQAKQRAGVLEVLLLAVGGTMSSTEKPIYTEFHPRWYRPRMSTYWWMKRGSYLAFIGREVSSVFVAWFVIYLLLLIEAVSSGKSDYEAFLAWTSHPVVVVLNLVSLFFIVFHAVTWFQL